MYIPSEKSIFQKLIFHILCFGIFTGTPLSPVFGQLDSATIEANTFFIPDSVTLNRVMTMSEMVVIYDKVFTLEDSLGTLNVGQVVDAPYAQQFIPNPTRGKPADKGTDPNKYYWVRIFFQANDLPFQHYMIGLPIYYDEIVVYERKGDSIVNIFPYGGFKSPPFKRLQSAPNYYEFYSREYDDMPLMFKPNERKELYLKLKPSERFTYPLEARNPISIRIISYEANFRANNGYFVRNLIFGVIFIVMALYHLVLYFSIRERMYLYFSGMLFFAFFYIGYFHFLFFLLSSHYSFSIGVPIVFGGFHLLLILMGRDYLQIDTAPQWLRKSFTFCIYAMLLYVAVFFIREFIIHEFHIYSRDHVDRMDRLSGRILFTLFLGVAGIVRYRQGIRPAGLFVIAMFVISAINLIPILRYFNIPFLPPAFIQFIEEKAGFYNFAIESVLPGVGISLTLFLLAIALSTRYNIIQKENSAALQKNLDLQIQINKELQEKSRLKEINRMKSRFFANITHEFRTPLTVILGMATQIKDNLQQTRLIQRNGKRLLRLINQLLDLSKLEAGQLKLHLIHQDVIPFLRYLTESFHSLAETKNMSLTFHSNMDELLMDFDSEKLQQIVSNLLSNAIKYTPTGGEVTLQVKSEKSNLYLKVQDNGKGISSDELPYIFDRFYQVDDSPTRQAEGTGIGLALTKDLTELMNGEVQAESEVGEGSVFTVIIPITHTAPLSEIPPTISSEIETQISEIVSYQPVSQDFPIALIIEDNKDVITYLQSCLQTDYQMEVAYDGEEGITKALEIVPDIIISDVMMPKKDGYEVCQTLKEDERTSHIPIVMLTAKATHEDKLEGLQRGADAYLMKPFDPVELEVRLQKLLAIRKQLKERYQSSEPDESPIFQREDKYLQKLRKIVEGNIEDEYFGVEALADKVKLSRSQLYRKLKALTDQPATQFIQTIRMKRALELLKTTDLQIAEVAYKVGYSDPSYFSRQFVKVYGYRPSVVKQKGA